MQPTKPQETPKAQTKKQDYVIIPQVAQKEI